MTRKTKMLIAGAALSGLLTGSASSLYAATPTPTRTTKAVDSAGAKAVKFGEDKKTDQHACKGKNACKGHGGCQSGDNGCKGKNSCKGKGGCSTMPKSDK